MTILDDRSGLDRLTPTPHSIVQEATQRFEAALADLGWDIWNNADDDTFKTIKSEKTRDKMASDLNEAGNQLYVAVVKLLRGLEDEVELEMIQLD